MYSSKKHRTENQLHPSIKVNYKNKRKKKDKLKNWTYSKLGIANFDNVKNKREGRKIGSTGLNTSASAHAFFYVYMFSYDTSNFD